MINIEHYQMEFLTGASALSKGNYQDAILHLEKALTLAKISGLSTSDDTFDSGYFNLGQAKKAINKYKDAINDFLKVVENNPTGYENAYLHIAECCFNINNYESMEIAIKSLNQCTKYFPNNQAAHMNKGIAYLNIGDKQNAKVSFNNAKQLGNMDADNFIRDYC